MKTPTVNRMRSMTMAFICTAAMVPMAEAQEPESNGCTCSMTAKIRLTPQVDARGGGIVAWRADWKTFGTAAGDKCKGCRVSYNVSVKNDMGQLVDDPNFRAQGGHGLNLEDFYGNLRVTQKSVTDGVADVAEIRARVECTSSPQICASDTSAADYD